MAKTFAVAIFVKTPEFSPVKTRLSIDLGEEFAKKFHIKAAETMEALGVEWTARHPNVQMYWSVAEEPALRHSRWEAFPRIWQGEGGLADRLFFIHKKLIQSHGCTVFLGNDSPMMSIQIMDQLQKWYSNNTAPFLMGLTKDGGFYFFASRIFIPFEIWNSVTYSQNDTAQKLIEALNPLGQTELIDQHFDVDESKDLPQILEIHPRHLIDSQISLQEWVRQGLLDNQSLHAVIEKWKDDSLVDVSSNDQPN